MNNKESLVELFRQTFGIAPEINELTGGGSSRKYFRLRGNQISVIGVIGDDVKENIDFINLTSLLENEKLNVPHLISVSYDKKSYLLQDLGDTQLIALLTGENKMLLSEKALSELIIFQTIPEYKWERLVGFKPFSPRLIKWDLNYFKYSFLKPSGILFDEDKLEDDFESLVSALCSPEKVTGLMYRDFQSRNIMVRDDKLWLIDFQGARKGPLLYDAASFIWQAKAPFSFEEREKLMKYYISNLSAQLNVSYDKLELQTKPIILFRLLQVLGAYGFRGLIEGKTHFLESLPLGIKNLRYLLSKGWLDIYPEIKKISEELDPNRFENEKFPSGKLTVTIYSFSYKKGLPEDKSGNGGGFVFDCRAIHNPGRYEVYKNLTGKDKEVIEFLERNGEAKNFVDMAFSMVSPSIVKYLKRGFNSLQVSFGCTGGQHRSVYCAELFAKMIEARFPDVYIRIIHREQNF